MPEPGSDVRAGRLAAMLRVDAAGAEVRRWLRAEGIDCVLLKGRALAQRLYDHPWQRPYSDTDLLIASEDRERVARLLLDRGYVRIDRDSDRLGEPGYAHTFAAPDGELIDLHWNLSGVRAAPARTWEAVRTRTSDMPVGGMSALVPRDDATALIVALHNAHHGARRDAAAADVERAVARIALRDWVAARELAVALDAGEAFAAGLRLSRGGAALADRLDAAGEIGVEYSLRASDTSYGAWAVHRLRSAPPASRARVLRTIVFPPPETMRLFFPLARCGRAGLAAAYLLRPFRLAMAALPALAEYRRKGRRN